MDDDAGRVSPLAMRDFAHLDRMDKRNRSTRTSQPGSAGSKATGFTRGCHAVMVIRVEHVVTSTAAHLVPPATSDDDRVGACTARDGVAAAAAENLVPATATVQLRGAAEPGADDEMVGAGPAI